MDKMWAVVVLLSKIEFKSSKNNLQPYYISTKKQIKNTFFNKKKRLSLVILNVNVRYNSIYS